MYKRQVFRNTTKKRVVVLAPTGIAALNVRGQTIHSFFGFPPRLLNKSEIEKRKNFRIYVNIDMIIIDEISMVRVDIIDNIDYFLRINRNVNADVYKRQELGRSLIFLINNCKLSMLFFSLLKSHSILMMYPYWFSDIAPAPQPVEGEKSAGDVL